MTKEEFQDLAIDPSDIDEAAEKMYPKQYAYMPKPGSTIDLGKVLRDAFKAGAEWQKEQDDKLVDIIYQQGIEKGKDEMRETLKKNEK